MSTLQTTGLTGLHRVALHTMNGGTVRTWTDTMINMGFTEDEARQLLNDTLAWRFADRNLQHQLRVTPYGQAWLDGNTRERATICGECRNSTFHVSGLCEAHR